jgi:Predicted membrane protein (DUF2306)
MLRVVAVMLALLFVPVGLLAVATAAGLLPLPYELALVDQRLPVVFRVHMLSAGLAVLLIPAAIILHGFRLHRIVGRSAAVLVLIGGLTAPPVALASEATWLARAGFLMQASVWIALVLAAVQAIRAGHRTRHMWLMLSVAAVASAALWLRLATWTAVKLGLPFDTVYAFAAWLSWIVPLAAVASLARSGGARIVSSPRVRRLESGGIP